MPKAPREFKHLFGARPRPAPAPRPTSRPFHAQMSLDDVVDSPQRATRVVVSATKAKKRKRASLKRDLDEDDAKQKESVFNTIERSSKKPRTGSAWFAATVVKAGNKSVRTKKSSAVSVVRRRRRR